MPFDVTIVTQRGGSCVSNPEAQNEAVAAAARGSLARGRRDVLIAAMLWSVGGVGAKWLTLDPLTIAFYRGLFAGLALVPFVPRSRRVVRPIMIPLGLCFGVMTALYLASIKRTTAANAILLQNTATFWVVPLGLFFLRERPDRRSLAGILLATCGIASIVGFGRDGRSGEWLGIAFGLASGLGYAVVVVALRGLRDLDPTWLSGFNNLAGAVVIAVFLLAYRGSIVIPGGSETLVLVGLGVFQMAISYKLFARGLRVVGAAEAGLLGLIEPILNPIWVWLVVGERPTHATMIGGALLLAGVAVRYWPTRRLTLSSETIALIEEAH